MRPPRPPQGVALRIQAIVEETPGIHFRGIGRSAGLTSTGQLRHHIDRLVRGGYIAELGDGGYRRYFPSHHAPDLQVQMARLSRDLPRRILRLLATGPMTRTTLRRHLACADSTLGYHLGRMLQHGDVVRQPRGSGTCYAVADPERAQRILAAQEPPTLLTETAAAAAPFIPTRMEPYILPAAPPQPPLAGPGAAADAIALPAHTPEADGAQSPA